MALTVTLFIPVRNEVDGLREIMPRINPAWIDEIFILDGGSTDGSREFLISEGYEIHDQKSKGVKGAFWEAFEQIDSDIIIPFSPDGNSIPEDIPMLIENIRKGFDMVIASRYFGGQKSDDDDIASTIANSFLTGLINTLFSTKYTDAIGMYKAFKKQHLYDLGIDQRRNEHSEIMLTTRGARYGLKIIEIPSKEPPRIGVQGSRAHPGIFGKYKSGFFILGTILRDAVFYWPNKAK